MGGEIYFSVSRWDSPAHQKIAEAKPFLSVLSLLYAYLTVAVLFSFDRFVRVAHDELAAVLSDVTGGRVAGVEWCMKLAQRIGWVCSLALQVHFFMGCIVYGWLFSVYA